MTTEMHRLFQHQILGYCWRGHKHDFSISGFGDVKCTNIALHLSLEVLKKYILTYIINSLNE